MTKEKRQAYWRKKSGRISSESLKFKNQLIDLAVY